ncbi:alpha/beta fold hydrolase [Streptomyces sp. ALI-76-A]|uniref:thioesterase II family protein n=1 Tax=Streptomyces sp. ALI-76-A TaxID=3025736 RepID=UPI00256ED602|nr:alpha/beta fold hydrolase [Streptomyces sp. ALI-76-A]MDL5205432.1 alpha/beta fold hydrolase [Streptomyces sp. ALI-76-A]
MPQPPEQFRTWVRRYQAAPDSAVRLVCLPHAGGSASFYFPLAKALAPAVEVLAVQYPGRQDRRHEPHITRLSDMADQIFAAVRHLDDRPLALFGHSMGAVLAYEIALRMQDAGLPAPVRLFASGRRAPSRDRHEQVDPGVDEEILAELLRLSGTPAELLADPEIREMIMPPLRSDYRAVMAHRFTPGRRPDCPVTVLTGDSDPRVTVDEAAAWEEHTTGPTELQVFPGGHFFLAEQSTRVAELIADRLAGRYVATRHEAWT